MLALRRERQQPNLIGTIPFFVDPFSRDNYRNCINQLLYTLVQKS